MFLTAKFVASRSPFSVTVYVATNDWSHIPLCARGAGWRERGRGAWAGCGCGANKAARSARRGFGGAAPVVRRRELVYDARLGAVGLRRDRPVDVAREAVLLDSPGPNCGKQNGMPPEIGEPSSSRRAAPRERPCRP